MLFIKDMKGINIKQRNLYNAYPLKVKRQMPVSIRDLLTDTYSFSWSLSLQTLFDLSVAVPFCLFRFRLCCVFQLFRLMASKKGFRKSFDWIFGLQIIKTRNAALENSVEEEKANRIARVSLRGVFLEVILSRFLCLETLFCSHFCTFVF